MTHRLAVSPLEAVALGSLWFVVSLASFAAFTAIGAGVWG